QDGRWMRRGHHVGSEIGRNQFPAIPGHSEILAEQPLGRTGAEADENLRLHNFQLRIEPGTARFDFRMTRLLMNAPLAALRSFPFEVLHHIRDVYLGAVDSHLDENFVQKPPRGSDKRMPLPVFVIAGLLPHKHDQSLGRSFSKNRLSRVLPQITASTPGSCSLQARKRKTFWQKRRGGWKCVLRLFRCHLLLSGKRTEG